MRKTLELVNGVSGADGAAREDLAENAADGHDAVAGEMIDGALRVAVLADLADPQADGRADRDLVADAEGLELALLGARVDGDDRSSLPGPGGHARLRKTPLFPPDLKSRRRRTTS